MNYIIRTILIAAALATSAAAQVSSFILEASPANLAQLSTQYGFTVVQSLDAGGDSVLITVPSATASAQWLTALAAAPSVSSIEPQETVETAETDTKGIATADPTALATAFASSGTVTYFGNQVRSAYPNQAVASLIQLSPTQGTFGPGTAVVAIIDTGVDPNHPALQGVLVPGYDFVHNTSGIPSEWTGLDPALAAGLQQSATIPSTQKIDPFALGQSTVVILDQSTVVILDGSMPKDFGHGTMVAGLVHLAAPGARIMPLKAFRSDGSSNLSDIVRAIYFAVDNGANVINMSFGTEVASPALQAAVSYALSNGVICVASSGNDGEQEMVYPAGFDGVIGVGSSTASDTRSVFSNWGVDSVWMAAPGEALVTTYPGNNYAGVWGTSFSAALVSGTVALMPQVVPGLSRDQVKGALEQGLPLPFSLGLGDVRLQLWTALNALVGQTSGDR